MMASHTDPGFQNRDTGGKIVAALERVAQAFRVLLWNECKVYGLSPIQVQLLAFLQHHEGAQRKVSYLAEEFNMTRATISEAVKSLEEKGLVEKRTEKQDNRSFIIHPTRKGKEMAGRVAAFATALWQPVHALPPDRQQALLQGLLHIIGHLQQQGIISMQRMCYTCAHYAPGGAGKTAFCRLLNRPLEEAQVRLDCPEHEPMAAIE